MEYTTISEACTLHARIGWQGLTKSEYLDEGDYYLVTGVDFNNGHIAFDTCHFVTKERYDQDQHIQLQLNDVLVTKDGTIGKVAFIDSPVDKPATLNSGVFVVRPKNPDLLLPEYLMIMLMSNHFSRFIEQIKVGCTIAHLNQEKFLRYEFPLPPVAEQKHIIEVYYSVSKIINHRQRQLLALDILIKARFVEMFGDPETNPMKWGCIQLGEICDLQNGYAFKSDDYLDHSTVLNCRMSNIRPDGGFDADYHPKYLPDEYWDTYQSYRLVDGDVIIAMTDMASDPKILGVPTIVKSNGHKFLLNQRVGKLLFRDTSRMNNTYVMFFLGQAYIRKSLAKAAGGSTQINVGKPAILSITILEPPLQLQDDFAHFVSQVDKSKAAVQKALDEAQLLFDSLMQQYFG